MLTQFNQDKIPSTSDASEHFASGFSAEHVEESSSSLLFPASTSMIGSVEQTPRVMRHLRGTQLQSLEVWGKWMSILLRNSSHLVSYLGYQRNVLFCPEIGVEESEHLPKQFAVR